MFNFIIFFWIKLSQHFEFQVDSWVFEKTRHWIQQEGEGDCQLGIALSHEHQ